MAVALSVDGVLLVLVFFCGFIAYLRHLQKDMLSWRSSLLLIAGLSTAWILAVAVPSWLILSRLPEVAAPFIDAIMLSGAAGLIVAPLVLIIAVVNLLAALAFMATGAGIAGFIVRKTFEPPREFIEPWLVIICAGVTYWAVLFVVWYFRFPNLLLDLLGTALALALALSLSWHFARGYAENLRRSGQNTTRFHNDQGF